MLPDARFVGASTAVITGVASIEEAGPEEASFLDSARHAEKLKNAKAGLLFVPGNLQAAPKPGQVYAFSKDPSLALAKLCELIERTLRPDPQPGVHPRAYVEPTATVARTASIGANCTVGAQSVIGERVVLESGVQIGRNVVIGDDTHLFQNVVVQDYCEVGKRVRMHPGVVIGGDGFGYIQVGSLPDIVHYKVPQIGNVVIEDDVEIGANATIDRARFGSTRIGQGTKIDNLVQIAHNVRIGRRCVICAHVGISGSTTLGDYVVIWGQAGIVGHVHIGNFAFIGAQAGVAKSLPDGAKVTGTPARPLLEMRKSEAALMRLPDMMSKLRKLTGGDDSAATDEAKE
jgi:UDP-3-O-[3-hydroxymyristoyl] glucosamine N-acyltransferase